MLMKKNLKVSAGVCNLVAPVSTCESDSCFSGKAKIEYGLDCKINGLRENHPKEIEASSGLAFKGIPEVAEVAVPVAHFPANQTASEEAETGAGAATPISGETIIGGGSGGGLGPVDYLRNSQHGVDPSIRAEVWEFLLGCYTMSNTAEYRRQLRTTQSYTPFFY
ncbi:hypothetical protein U1Q18_031391 [Sarracenia purpurea var. burkii]